MNHVNNTINLGDMVIRAYAWEIDEFGLVIDSTPWRETLIPDGPEDIWETDQYEAMDGVEVFTVLWPSGDMTTEMDAELFSFEYYTKAVLTTYSNIVKE